MKPAIIFDIDDTLYDQISLIIASIEDAVGSPIEDHEYFFSVYQRWVNLFFDEVEKGKMSLHDSRIYRIVKTMEELGTPISEKNADDFQRFYQERLDNLVLSDRLTELFQWLSEQDVFLGVVTNGPSRHQRNKYRALGLDRWIPPERVLVSEEAGIAKPFPEIYRIAAGKFGIEPSKTYMVGDSWRNDIVPSKAAGWKAVWFNRHGFASGAECRPDLTVRTEQELDQRLRSLVKESLRYN